MFKKNDVVNIELDFADVDSEKDLIKKMEEFIPKGSVKVSGFYINGNGMEAATLTAKYHIIKTLLTSNFYGYSPSEFDNWVVKELITKA